MRLQMIGKFGWFYEIAKLIASTRDIKHCLFFILLVLLLFFIL